jgi:(S)-ureidoglycine aminohydrolase
MKKISLLIHLFLPLFVVAQYDSLSSGIYSWKEPKNKDNKRISSVILFEGTAHDMEWLQMSSNILLSSRQKYRVQVPENEEHLLIIKSGYLTIGRDSSYLIGPGSVALFMPGDAFLSQNAGKDPCQYFLMKYRSKNPMDIERGNAADYSLIKDWNKVEFKPHDKGGRRDFFARPTAMSKRFEMHVTTLNEGIKSHDPHTHKAEEIVLVIDGKTEMQIGDKFYKGSAGNVYYLGSNISHAIQNDGRGTCTYFAFQFE